jgi:uncharacterized protein (UPF0335 family)
MPKTLRPGVKIIFEDGDTREVKPLTIKQLRRFVVAIEGLDTEKANLSSEDIDRMTEAVSIALEKADPELSQDRERLEDVLTIQLFNEILAAAMGADPNALAAATTEV